MPSIIKHVQFYLNKTISLYFLSINIYSEQAYLPLTAKLYYLQLQFV